jgi:hypothetical protein
MQSSLSALLPIMQAFAAYAPQVDKMAQMQRGRGVAGPQQQQQSKSGGMFADMLSQNRQPQGQQQGSPMQAYMQQAYAQQGLAKQQQQGPPSPRQQQGPPTPQAAPQQAQGAPSGQFIPTDDLARAKAAQLAAQQKYNNTQQTRMTGDAGSLESVADIIRAPFMRKKLEAANEDLLTQEQAYAKAIYAREQAGQQKLVADRAATLIQWGYDPETAAALSSASLGNKSFKLSDYKPSGETDKGKQRKERIEWIRNTDEGKAFARNRSQDEVDAFISLGQQPDRSNIHTYSPNLSTDTMWKDPQAVSRGDFSAGAEPIPGSKLDLEIQGEERKAEGARQHVINTTENVIKQITDVRSLMDNGWRGALTTGLPGQAIRALPLSEWTDAAALAEHTTTIVSNVAMDRLQRMREVSPTGGALGNVSNFEVEQLQKNTAPLNPNMNREQYEDSLDDIQRSYDRLNYLKRNEEQLRSIADDPELGTEAVIQILDKKFGEFSNQRRAELGRSEEELDAVLEEGWQGIQKMQKTWNVPAGDAYQGDPNRPAGENTLSIPTGRKDDLDRKYLGKQNGS